MISISTFPVNQDIGFIFSGLFIPYQHLTPIARDAGIAHSKAAFLISVIGNT